MMNERPEPWLEMAWAEAREAKRLKRFPCCAICGEHIDQEDAVCFHGEWICDDCLDDLRVVLEEMEEEYDE